MGKFQLEFVYILIILLNSPLERGEVIHAVVRSSYCVLLWQQRVAERGNPNLLLPFR